MVTHCGCQSTGHDRSCPFNPLATRFIPVDVTIYPQFPIQPMAGWLCPRCQVIHSPWVERCYCEPVTYTIGWDAPRPIAYQVTSQNPTMSHC